MKKIIVMLLACIVLLTGCTSVSMSSGTDLMTGVQGQYTPANGDITEEGDLALTALGLMLLQKCAGEKSTLISPLSIAMALGMTANGAREGTLAGMEQVLGLPIEKLNRFLAAYGASLPQGDTFGMHLANGIWIRKDGQFVPDKEFLQANADYYRAALRMEDFDDGTLQEINGFVKKNTDGMIERILDRIPEESLMYLVNALAFESKWDAPYNGNNVWSMEFMTESGEKQSMQGMHSTEYLYLENKDITGFIRPYAENRYAFVALLPKEGKNVGECLLDFSAQSLRDLLTNPQQTAVQAVLPKFEKAYDAELQDALSTLGMEEAFDPNKADFSGMGVMENGDTLYIGRVLHKTFISVAEEGTRAGAATVVEMEAGSALLERSVCLDRPFIYLIVDMMNKVPLFMGTLMEI